MRDITDWANIEALLEHWRTEPTVDQLAAVWMGYEAPPSAAKQRAFEEWADKQLGGR